VTQVVESQLPGSANPRELIVRTLTGSNRLARFSSQLSVVIVENLSEARPIRTRS